MYQPADAQRLLDQLNAELEQDRRWLAELDRDVLVTHFQMALHLSPELAGDLVARYCFHIELQKIWQELRNHDAPVTEATAFLQQRKTHRLDNASFQKALPVFRAAHHVLRDVLRKAENLPIPPLTNMIAGQPLRKVLLESKLVNAVSKHDRTLSGKWIHTLGGQMREVQKKVDRVHFKSLGGILALQERIVRDCDLAGRNLPAVPPVPIP
jgi:hypothetical protein